MDISSLSAYTDYYSQLASASDTSSLSNKISSASSSETTDDELMDVCKQFESYLLEQVFKNMEKTVSLDEDEDSSTSQLVDYFKDQTIQEISSEATETQGTGLAQMLYEQLKRNMGVSAETLARNNAESGTAGVTAE